MYVSCVPFRVLQLTTIQVHRTIQYQSSLTGMPTTDRLSPTFNLSYMLSTLHKLRDSFRIRVRHVSSFAYLLDLDTCYDLLSCLKKPEFDLKDVFNGGKPLEIAEKWAKAVIESAAGTTEAVSAPFEFVLSRRDIE